MNTGRQEKPHFRQRKSRFSGVHAVFCVNGYLQGGTDFKEYSIKTAVLTVGQIAEQLGQPPSRVAYVISRDRLKPVGRVGIIRLFSEQHRSRPFNGAWKNSRGAQ